MLFFYDLLEIIAYNFAIVIFGIIALCRKRKGKSYSDFLIIGTVISAIPGIAGIVNNKKWYGMVNDITKMNVTGTIVIFVIFLILLSLIKAKDEN